VNPLYAEGLALAVVGLTLEAALGLAAPAIAGTEPRIARAVEHVEAHLPDVASIAEMAAVACMSPSHFARAFRAAMGEAPWAYVLRRRTERAVRRIRLTRVPLVAIAYDCGFADADAMARAVRRHAGVPPSALRGDG
jgi:AraC family transcriptional regulator